MSGYDGNNDYVEVGERISKFFEKYPDGSIQNSEARVISVGDKTFIAVTSTAYRTPDDPRPGVGQAWEPFPGRTAFTRDSEAMNAETSAVGRALAMLGVAAKRSIATREEISRREQDRAAEGQTRQIRRNQTSTEAATDEVVAGLGADVMKATTVDALRALWDAAGRANALDREWPHPETAELISIRDLIMRRTAEIDVPATGVA